MDAEGNHRLCGTSEWDVVWLRPDELIPYFHRDVDGNQIRRLSATDRDAFLKQAGHAMERLGYSVSTPANAVEDAEEPCILPFPEPPCRSHRLAFRARPEVPRRSGSLVLELIQDDGREYDQP